MLLPIMFACARLERYSRLHHWMEAPALPPDPEQILGAIRARAEVGSQLASASS